MNKYSLIVLITLGVVAIALFSYFRDNGHMGGEQLSTPPRGTTPVAQNGAVVQPLSVPDAILYTDNGFAPNPLRIKLGSVVTFVNNSSGKLWPASDIHPTHAQYPTTGGCLGSTFDACRGIMPGEVWQFKFDIAGTWSYHNHLNPQDIGTIVVE